MKSFFLPSYTKRYNNLSKMVCCCNVSVSCKMKRQSVLKELNVVELLSAGGVVRQTGSTVLGLMVWHDIDLQVSSPGLSIGHAFEIMHPLLTHPRVKQQRMISTSTSTNATKTFPWPKCSQIFAPRISACWPPPGH